MTARPKTPPKHKPRKAASRSAPAYKPDGATKKDQLIALLRRPGGQDVAALGAALGWQAHTVRAALTGLRKAGFAIERVADNEGVGRYRIGGGP